MSDIEHLTQAPGDCERLQELLPAFAFGLLDENERAQVEALLPACPEYADELGEYQSLAARMLVSATPVEPPPDLLGRLLQAASTAPVSGEFASLKPSPAKTLPAKTVPSRPIGTQSEAKPPIRQLPLRQLPRPDIRFLSGAAAVLLVVVLTGWVLVQTSRLSQTVQSQTSLLNMFASDQVVSFELTDPGETPTTAHAVVLCNPEERAAVIRAENLPVSTDNSQFHIWLWIDREHRIDGGILDVNANGWGTMVFEAPDVMGNYQWVSLTPVKSSESPAQPVVAGALYATPPDDQQSTS